VRLTNPAACHALRHFFTTHSLEDRYDIRIVQELLGHADVSTILISIHVLNRGGQAVRSPADALIVNGRAEANAPSVRPTGAASYCGKPAGQLTPQPHAPLRVDS
jgi:hypothetical protein